MPNKDIYFVSSERNEETQEVYTYAYGLKPTGEKYYNKLNEIGYKEINLRDFDYLNGINVKIEDKEYPLICSETVCKLIDYENNEIYNKSFIDFFNNNSGGEETNNISIKGPIYFPMINLKQDNKILFINIVEDGGKESFNFCVSKFFSKNLTLINKGNIHGQLEVTESHLME